MTARQSGGGSLLLRRRAASGVAAAAAVLVALAPAGGRAQSPSGESSGERPGLRAPVLNSGNGAVEGTVLDASGAAIPGATVSLHNVENGTDAVTTTAGDGGYRFPSVLPGSYVITVRMAGYSTGDTGSFQVAANLHQRVDVPLELKGSTETVEVNAGGLSLETATGDRRQILEQTEIQNLPLNAREYTDLALLSPGASLSLLDVDPIEPRRGSFHMSGMRSSVNNFLLDGIDNNSYQNSNLGYNNQTITPSPDGIQSLTIITSNFPAEYGRSGGSVLNTVSRSGTDRLRFTLWEYLRNTILNAYGPLRETGHKPSLAQNQFGGTLGGPTGLRNLFFFSNYEGFRISNNTYAISTLPTMDERQGIFYGVTGLATPITNPYTGVEYADGRMPAGDITPFAAAVMAVLPAPTNDGWDYNYVARAHGQNTRDLGELRLDWSPGTRLRLFSRYSGQVNHIVPAAAIPGNAGGYGDGHVYSAIGQLAAGATYVLTQSSLLDLRLGVTRANSGKRPLNFGKESFYSLLNIPYPIAPQAGTVALNTQLIGDITALGTEAQTNIYESPLDVDLRPAYSVQHVRHTFGFGYELLALKTPTAWQAPVYGEDIYDGHFTRTVAAPAGSVPDYLQYYTADFLYGARSQYELSNYSRLTQNMRFHSLYGNDNWRILPAVTLNYGLRYELTAPDFESMNHLANFNPATRALELAGSGSYAARALTGIRYDNWAPRFGLAWAMAPRLVWRAGYGISYIQFNRNADFALEYNGPYSITSIIQQDSPESNVCPAGSQSFTCFRTTMQGYPSSMNSGIGFNTQLAESYYMPRSQPTGMIQDYFFALQLQPDPHSILDVAYVGSHAVHVRVISDYNWAPPVSLGNLGTLPYRRPIKNFGDIWTALPAGFLRYNSLQVKFQERYRSLFLISSLTWSQARDNASGDQESYNGDTPIVNLSNIKGDSGISGYNQPLNSTTALTWTLPRPAFRAAILRALLDDWRVSILNSTTSGLPMNLYWAPSSADYATNIGYHYRPDFTGSGVDYQATLNPKRRWLRLGQGQYVGNVFNLSYVAAPTAETLYGNMPRNSMRFEPIWQASTTVMKDIRIREYGMLELRAEAFNVPNRTNWNTPDLDVSSGAFGYIGGAMPSRQLEFALRYSY